MFQLKFYKLIQKKETKKSKIIEAGGMSLWLVGICVEKTVKPRPRVDTLFSAQGNKSFPQFPANVSITLSLWMRGFDCKERTSFISVT